VITGQGYYDGTCGAGHSGAGSSRYVIVVLDVRWRAGWIYLAFRARFAETDSIVWKKLLLQKLFPHKNR
jgi:hypothetical protein